MPFVSGAAPGGIARTAPSSDLEVSVTRRRRRARAVNLGLGLAIAGVALLSAGTGQLDVSPAEALRLVVGHLVPDRPWMSDGSLTAVQDQTVWQFRLPRTLLAGLAGAALALAGVLMQAVVRNPLADPYLLGVSAGAGLGAALVVAFGTAALAGLSLNGAAFVGSVVATLAVHALARDHSGVSPTRLLLAGVALASLFGAATNLVTLTTDAHAVFSVLFFVLGSVSGATWDQLVWPLAAVVVVGVLAAGRARSLNALLLGDEAATSMGVDVRRTRVLALAGAATLTAATVAVSGGIGFVGLVVPHMARMVVGVDHRRLAPTAMLGGALLLMVCDLCARTLADPLEVPIGIVTAIAGAPFFLWLMRTGAARRSGYDR